MYPTAITCNTLPESHAQTDQTSPQTERCCLRSTTVRLAQHPAALETLRLFTYSPTL